VGNTKESVGEENKHPSTLGEVTDKSRIHNFFYVVLSSSCLNTMPLLVLSICLTCHFRVTVSALLSLVGPAHQLLLPLAAFKCDVF